MFWTAVPLSVLCDAPTDDVVGVIVGYDILRITCRETKICFELARAGGSSYPGFELPEVGLQEMYGGNTGEIEFWFELARGSS